jgi:hypothetical protein
LQDERQAAQSQGAHFRFSNQDKASSGIILAFCSDTAESVLPGPTRPAAKRA